MRAKVWIDAEDSLIRQFESTDPNGVTRKVRMISMTLNADVKPATFTFKVPKGVRVVQSPQ